MQEEFIQTRKVISPIVDRAVMNIIAVVREDGTWSSYMSEDSEDFHEVLAYGKIVPQNVANFLFPVFAQGGYCYKGE